MQTVFKISKKKMWVFYLKKMFEGTNDFQIMPSTPPVIEADPNTSRRLRQTQTSFDAPSEVTPLPLRDSNQAFMLLNLTHKAHRPRSEYPGFRILGAFPSLESIHAHIKKHFEGSDCSLFVTPAHELMGICESTEQQQNVEYNTRLIDDISKLHSDAAELREREFIKNVQERKTGSLGESTFSKQRIQLPEEKKEPLIGQETGSLPATACIAKQNFAAIITLSDLRPAALNGSIRKEPLLAILGVFATEEEASNYGKYTASKQYPKCAIDIVDLFSWCFPENIDTDQIKEVYGSDQLNDIMRGRKENTKLTERFMSWCDQNNVQPAVTELENPAPPL
jgi:hypothetical protein